MGEALAKNDEPTERLLQAALRRLQADISLHERVREIQAALGAGTLPNGQRRSIDDIERALDGLL